LTSPTWPGTSAGRLPAARNEPGPGRPAQDLRSG